MNKVVNNFLLAGQKFMPEMHLKQPKFTCNACGPFTINKERIKELKKQKNMIYLSKGTRESLFQQEMAYEYFKELPRSIELLIKYCVIRHLILLKIQNMMDISGDYFQWFIIF